MLHEQQGEWIIETKIERTRLLQYHETAIARSQIGATRRNTSFSKLDDNLARSMLSSRLSIRAAKNTTTTDDCTSLVAVGLTKCQTSRLGGSGTNDEFLLSRDVGVGRRISSLACGGSAGG
jgi:hypothetical protein